MAQKASSGGVEAWPSGVCKRPRCAACKERDRFGGNTARNSDVYLYEAVTHFVYELRLQGEPVYVGMTRNLKSRLAGHRRSRQEPRIQYGKIIEVCCYHEAAALESSEIIRRRLRWNGDRRTPHQKDPQKASLEEARLVWLSATYENLTNGEVAEMIPGWSAFMCYDWFGSRYGQTSGGRGADRRDIEERIRLEI